MNNENLGDDKTIWEDVYLVSTEREIDNAQGSLQDGNLDAILEETLVPASGNNDWLSYGDVLTVYAEDLVVSISYPLYQLVVHEVLGVAIRAGIVAPDEENADV